MREPFSSLRNDSEMANLTLRSYKFQRAERFFLLHSSLSVACSGNTKDCCKKRIHFPIFSQFKDRLFLVLCVCNVYKFASVHFKISAQDDPQQCNIFDQQNNAVGTGCSYKAEC